MAKGVIKVKLPLYWHFETLSQQSRRQKILILLYLKLLKSNTYPMLALSGKSKVPPYIKCIITFISTWFSLKYKRKLNSNPEIIKV